MSRVTVGLHIRKRLIKAVILCATCESSDHILATARGLAVHATPVSITVTEGPVRVYGTCPIKQRFGASFALLAGCWNTSKEGPDPS
jgi:hypothetical protein